VFLGIAELRRCRRNQGKEERKRLSPENTPSTFTNACMDGISLIHSLIKNGLDLI
jgi:hypothetical protein